MTNQNKKPSEVTAKDMLCCLPECHNAGTRAEWEIWAHRPDGSTAGPDPYPEYTHACTAHVGYLLGHQPEASDPGNIVYSVYPIQGFVFPKVTPMSKLSERIEEIFRESRDHADHIDAILAYLHELQRRLG